MVHLCKGKNQVVEFSSMYQRPVSGGCLVKEEVEEEEEPPPPEDEEEEEQRCGAASNGLDQICIVGHAGHYW